MASRQPPSHSQVVLVAPGFFSAGRALVWRLLTRRPVIYIRETSFVRSAVGRVWQKLSGAIPLDLGTCTEPDSGYFYGDKHDTAATVARWLYTDPNVQQFSNLFDGVDNAEQKLLTVIRAYVDGSCLELTHLAGFLSGHPEIAHTTVVSPLSAIQKRYLEALPFPVSCPPAPDLDRLVARISSAGQRLLRPVTARIKRRKTTSIAPRQPLPGLMDAGQGADSQVLYFPHQTVSYGGLFYKDQFYSNDPQSPFHSSQLMHVEARAVDGNKVPESLNQYYAEKQIRWCYLPRPDRNRRGRLLIHLLGQTLRTIGLPTIHRRRTRITLGILARALWQFRLYQSALAVFPAARMALIGYEVLFPKMLYLALESRGVRTVASQERFHVSVLFDNWNYFLHTYFCCSQRIAEILQQSRFKHIHSTVPTGFVRTDLLVHYRQSLQRHDVLAESAGFSRLVVLFDAPVFRDSNIARLMYVANWRCNIAYYEEMLALAEECPEALFVIRCKDIEWLDIPQLAEVVGRIAKCNNLIIHRDYSSFAMQYKLAAVADLVISKYSSIGDECLSSAIPTIFHDYTAMQSSSAWRTCQYDDLPIFAHDYPALLEKTRKTLANGRYLSESDEKAVAMFLNDWVADGQVHQRIQQHLQTQLVEVKGET